MQTGKGLGDNGIWRHRKTERNPLFAGRWFEDDIILLCLRWYFRFKLSDRDRVAILGERGLPISHTTILRWVVRYAETCEKRWHRFERRVGGSWRVDERLSRCGASGCTCIEPWMDKATPWSSI